jgi:hypothetical protein
VGFLKREKRRLSRFKKDIERCFPGASVIVHAEHFLPIPVSHARLLQEVEFLRDGESRLVEFLASDENLPHVVRHIIGAILPFHTARTAVSLREAIQRSRSVISQELQHDRTDVVEELRAALRDAAERASHRRQDPALLERQKRAKKEALQELASAVPSREAPRDTPAAVFFDRKEAVFALEAIYRLGDDSSACLFRRGSFRLFHYEEAFWLTSGGSKVKLSPLHRLLKKSTLTHLDRVGLILSFAHALSEFAQAGIVVETTRFNEPRYRELYQASGGSNLLVGDLGVLSLRDVSDQILEPEWVRGSIISDAIRYIYYGSATKEGARRTAVYRRVWNDNIAFDIAERFDGVGLIRADVLERELRGAFGDERSSLPLFFHGVDKQFIQDLADSGLRSIAEAVGVIRPTRLLLDRGPDYRKVYFAFSDRGQIGFLHEKAALSFTLYRYIPYRTRRWKQRFDRDVTASVSLAHNGKTSGVFVGLSDRDDAARVAKDLFGYSEPVYRRFLERLIGSASRHADEMPLPEVLQPEAKLLELRRERLDALRLLEVPFTMFIDNAGPPRVGETLFLSVVGTVNVALRLKRLQYSSIDSRSGLSVRAVDALGRRLFGIFKGCDGEPSDEALRVEVTYLDPNFSTSAKLRFSDPGSDAVVKSEETLLRDLRFSLSDQRNETPALWAWRLVEPILGSDPLWGRSSENLWCEETRVVGPTEAEDRAETIGDWTAIRLLTGAPGTGKTRVAARLAAQHLEERSGQLNPCARVLVVAASHFGIDNFLRTFLEVSSPGIHIYRNVPRLRLDSLKTRGILDAPLHDRLSQDLEQQKAFLPIPTRRAADQFELSDYATRLRTELEEAEAALGTKDPPSGAGKAHIPSHENWRNLFGAGSDWHLPVEFEMKGVYLRNRLSDLDAFKDLEKREASDEESPVGENLYLQLGSDLVATTPDAFKRVPDMTYSLVILEEASQLSSLKILKVLAQVARPLGPDEIPPILLSGDPQQLPPFIESYSAAGDSADEDILSSSGLLEESLELVREFRRLETPFERMCGRVRPETLQVQHRMHPDIATLINSLFYSSQHWTSSRPAESGAVTWINTHGLRPKARLERDGTSLYNREEKAVVNELVRDWVRPGQSVLVVSPYTAQVTTLSPGIDRLVSVRTIDGCQGIEADVVIVSFVTFRFSESRDFVVDPRRMNVALSRAREMLFLVGDLDDLRANVSRLPLGHRYQHLSGLSYLFSRDGYFRECVRHSTNERITG